MDGAVIKVSVIHARVGKLAKPLDLESRVCGFDFHLGYQFCSGRLVVNRHFDMVKIAGSTPARNTKVYASLAELVEGARL